jgi:hypothetical protein
MHALRRLVVRAGAATATGPLITAVLALNVTWLVILAAIGTQFERLAGVPLLDLQNSVLPGEAMTPARALAQIASYPPEAVGLYWSFFILDTVMPLLVFGSFALLWANLLHARTGRLRHLVLGTPLLLAPFGVGLFDWIENLAYVSAIAASDTTTATAVLWIGLVAKWVKAAFIPVTFLVTGAVAAAVLLARWRAGRPATAQPAERTDGVHDAVGA